MDKDKIREIVTSAVQEFTADWKQEPYKWLYEIDIQNELTLRIKKFTPRGWWYIEARHEHDKKDDRIFSRVTCQPYVKIDEKHRAIHPDIVIWNDPNDKKDFINRGFFPIMWSCEIKSSFTKKEYPEDERRLRELLRERTQLASQIIFVQNKAGFGSDIESWNSGNFFRWIIESAR